MARWGMPSPAFALQGRKTDPGVTNVRNVKSPHWRRWLGPESRCVVPWTSFSEPEPQPDGSRPPAWFALAEDRPLAFFAGIWVQGWTSVRKVRERSEEHTSELQSLMRISYAVFCLKKKNITQVIVNEKQIQMIAITDI